jgi:hypothetical protein
MSHSPRLRLPASVAAHPAPPAMTLALLLALVGSLGLMAWIVRRLERAR